MFHGSKTPLSVHPRSIFFFLCSGGSFPSSHLNIWTFFFSSPAKKKRPNESMNMFNIAEILLIPLVFWIITGNGLTIYAILRLMPVTVWPIGLILTLFCTNCQTSLTKAKTCNIGQRRKRFTFLYLLSSAIADFLIGALIAPIGLYQGQVLFALFRKTSVQKWLNNAIYSWFRHFNYLLIVF